MKKFAGDIIILQIHTKNHDHMMYGSRDTESDRRIFFHFGQFFALSAPDNLENQNFKIEESTWGYYDFTHLHHK